MSARRELYPPQERTRADKGFRRCPRCSGKGHIPGDEQTNCPACDGEGQINNKRRPNR